MKKGADRLVVHDQGEYMSIPIYTPKIPYHPYSISITAQMFWTREIKVSMIKLYTANDTKSLSTDSHNASTPVLLTNRMKREKRKSDLVLFHAYSHAQAHHISEYTPHYSMLYQPSAWLKHIPISIALPWLATCFMRRSCSCKLWVNTSAIQANLATLCTLPQGMSPICILPMKGSRCCSYIENISMSFTGTTWA